MIANKILNTGISWWKVGIFLFLTQIFSVNSNTSSLIQHSSQFQDSLIISLTSTELSLNELKRILKNKKTIKELNYSFDSLGFFNPEQNRSNDTIFYFTGYRSFIDTILFQSTNDLKLNIFIEDFSFPFAYNSAIIDKISKDVINYCANNGYPFASISIQIDEAEKNITPTIMVKSGKKYCFAPPLLNKGFLLNHKTFKNDLIIKNGKTFNLNDINETISRLQQRPYIKSVIAKEPVIIPQSFDIKKDTTSTNCEDNVTIPLEIIENSGMGIDGILGYSSLENGNGWNGEVNLILQNVLHRGEALAVNYRGEENLKEFNLTLDKAYPFSLPFLFSGYFDLEIQKEKYGSLKGGFELLTSLKRNLQIGFGMSGHEPTLDDGSSWYSINFNLLLRVLNSTYGSQIKNGAFNLKTGSGYRDKDSNKQGQFSFTLSAEGQFPFLKKNAFYAKFYSGLITTGEEDLHETEMIRVGGHNSLRGYAIDEYSFTACAFLQFEYRFYFLDRGSLFLFADGGAGSQNEINRENSTSLFGYGLGIRVPIRMGRLSLEYGRNYQEGRSPGRIHIRIQNSLSKGM